MLLTIHNLPSSTRYADIKALLQEKCGLSDIIVDNLVSEGKSKKVTVGLATDHDGAFVVRKLNGLFMNGQQLYIEDRRRKTDDQPYRPASFEPEHSTIQPAIAPIVPAWNLNTTPYMQPVVQNLAYSGYGGAPLATPYMEPHRVLAETPGYSGYQDEAYAPVTLPRNQEPDRGRNARDQPPDGSRRNDRKRRHSPERPAANKRSSRFDNFNRAKNRHEPSPPHRRWSEERAFKEAEQFSRPNQNVEAPYQPREPSPRQTDPQWERNPRWDEPSARPERAQQWGNDNRDWEPPTAKVWDSQPQQLREGPRQWDNQPKPQWDNQPQQQWEIQPKPQWDNQPKPQWENQRKSQWDNQPAPQWDTQPKPQWDNQPKPQWENQPKPQWDNQPAPQWGNQTRPQWEGDSSIPVENIRSEQFDHLASNDPPRNDREFQPRDHGRYNDRHQNKGFNKRNTVPTWKEPGNSFSTPNKARPQEKTPRNGSRSKNERPGRDWSDNRPVPSRDLSGGRKRPDFGKPKEYPSREFKNQARVERNAPNVKPRFETPRHERGDRPNAKENRFIKEKKSYPPVSGPPVKKPVESSVDSNKPQTYRSLINKDQSNRGQATALLAKTVIGVQAESSYVAKSPLDNYIFKQLKVCIKSRIDLLLGEEMSVHMGDVVKRYRQKYPINQDKKFMQQIREKSTKEFVMKPKQPKEEKDEAGNNLNGIKVKKEKEETAKMKNNGVNENKDAKDKRTEQGGTAKNKDQTAAVAAKKTAVPLVPPNMPKAKPGKPLTDKQIIQRMKLQRKWEYDQDDLYSLDDIHTTAVDDEMADLDQLFTEEFSKPDDEQEATIFRRISTDGLSDFNKTIRLNITKRLLNIQTGLALRMFATGKLPKKEAVLQYLKHRGIKAVTVRKSVKGNMVMVNLDRFEDYDALCSNESDVIDGTPVAFKAMHLIGPPPKLNKNQVRTMRRKRIDNQIEDLELTDFEEVDFEENGNEDVPPEHGDAGNVETPALNTGELQTTEDFTEDLDLDFAKPKDIQETENFAEDVDIGNINEDFAEGVNIDNINEEDLEDF